MENNENKPAQTPNFAAMIKPMVMNFLATLTPLSIALVVFGLGIVVYTIINAIRYWSLIGGVEVFLVGGGFGLLFFALAFFYKNSLENLAVQKEMLEICKKK